MRVIIGSSPHESRDSLGQIKFGFFARNANKNSSDETLVIIAESLYSIVRTRLSQKKTEFRRTVV